MARVTWLPDALRAAGLIVHEYSGLATRGYDGFNPVAVVCHGTAGSLTSTDEGEMRVLWVTGSSSAPAPIAQAYLSRSGEWWVGATGTCNHIGNAPLPGTGGQYGNDNAIGIEAQHNPSEPWTAVQYDSYVRGVAAILRYTGWGVERVFGHYEISSSGKTDPYFDMNDFRRRVSAALAGEDDDVSATDVVVGMHRLFDEAANRSTPTGRQVGDDLAAILSKALTPVQAQVNALLAAAGEEVQRDAEVRAELAGLRQQLDGVAATLENPAEATAEEIVNELRRQIGLPA